MISRSIHAPSKRSFFLFGPRTTGKSTWLKHTFPDALRIDLLKQENLLRYLADPGALDGEVGAHLKRNPSTLILIDEIQRVPELLNEIHRLIEDRGARFGLTGSSARKLKRGGANLLAGRATEMHLFPFTPMELGSDFELEAALRWGTLPPVWLSDAAEKRDILRSYASVYLREEIQAEGLVRNLPSFSKFLQLAAEGVSRELNYSAISRETGVASKTIASFFTILEDTLIGFHLPPWTRSVRKGLAGSPKFYLFDNGITNALRENLSDPPKGDVYGMLFEQFVIQQVRALLSYRGFEGSLSFWRARGGLEVDLVISRGRRPLLAVEIKSTRNPGPRDFAGLASFQEEFPDTPGVVVSRQPRPSLHGSQESLPVLDFLNRLSAGDWL
ncbi:MAG: ATP-binding protein [Proteobacteria bacterium]|nr:ATP-binding protein [Pseudomonadota bacterium]